MISRLLLPSVVRLELRIPACDHPGASGTGRSCTARLDSRLPPPLRQCLTTLPEEASMGATPYRLAKEASLPNLLGLSPATIKSLAALSVPMPGKETNSGAACAHPKSHPRALASFVKPRLRSLVDSGSPVPRVLKRVGDSLLKRHRPTLC